MSNSFQINNTFKTQESTLPEFLFSKIEKEYNAIFDEQSHKNLVRIVKAANLHSSLLRYSYDLNLVSDSVIKIAIHSNYLTDIIVRHPEFLSYSLNKLTDHPAINLPVIKEQIKKDLALYSSDEKKITYLIRVKRRELLRIAIKDLLKISDTEEILHEWSELTDTLLGSILKISVDSVRKKFNIRNPLSGYIMIALGKLGGNELNYSSDADLLFIYEDSKPVKGLIDNSEVFQEIIRQFISFSHKSIDNDFLYRVDFRLRPDGKNSPLCRSLKNTLFYYESNGQPWERQMLLKSRFLCGNPDTYSVFKKNIDKFIFPGFSFEPPQEIVKKFKFLYEEKIKDRLNVKFTDGGIRDIEFLTQVLQLIYGKDKHDIRTTSTIQAILRLSSNNIITQKISYELYASYIFLRKIENYFQLAENNQTYSIPDDDIAKKKLAAFLGFESKAHFLARYFEVLDSVYSIYKSVIGKKSETSGRFARINFPNSAKAQNQINQLRNNFHNNFSKFSFTTQHEMLELFLSGLFRFLTRAKKPDMVVENLMKIFYKLNFSVSSLEIISNYGFSKKLFKLCSINESLINELTLNSGLMDLVFSGKIFRTKETPVIFSAYNEFELTLLRFYLKVNLLSGYIQLSVAEKLLCDFFHQAIINKSKELAEKLKINPRKFSVYLLGSYGSGEATLNSDLDILFVFEDSEKFNARYQKYFQQLLNELSAAFPQTEFDTRLRPEGKNSPIAWSCEELVKYINNRARIWEFQSYKKLKFIFGAGDHFQKIQDAIISRLRNWSLQNIFEAINQNKILMKQSSLLPSKDSINLKLSAGGMTDITFVFDFIYFIQKSDKILFSYLTKDLKAELKLLRVNARKLLYISQILTIYFDKRKPVITPNEINDKTLKNILKIDKNINIIENINLILNTDIKIINKINKKFTDYTHELNKKIPV